MNAQNLCVVLCHPDESRNVGSVCRAMANNDVTDLRIVGKKTDYDEIQVKTLSIHAFYIWENAKFYDTLKDAVKDCSIAAGTTRRRGKKRKDFLCLCEEFAEIASKVPSPEEDAAGGGACNSGEGACDSGEGACDSGEGACKGAKIAVIFGNERTGLTDEELEDCTIGVNIPSSDDFGSLNLSHAVQVTLYALFRRYTKKQNGYTPISLERLDETVGCVADNLQKIGFFKLAGREDMENFWRGILSRAVLSEGEAQYLEKVFNKMSGLAQKNSD